MAITKGWSIDENTFPKRGKIEDKIKFLLKYGVLAASSHNTQPWKFKIQKNILEVIPDFNKKLPIVDSENRELWISMGTFLENFKIAGEHFGFKIREKITTKKIILTLTKDTKKSNVLFNFITQRKTNRRKPRRIKVTKKDLGQIKVMKFEKETNAYFFEEKNDLIQIINLVKEANEELYSKSEFKTELINWTRFNQYESRKTKDGICYKVLDIPPTPKKLGRRLMRFFLNPSSINAEEQKRILNSSGIIILTSKKDDQKNWVKVGKTLERILLKLTSLKIDYAFINSPCEVKKTRRKLIKITKEFPQIILRLGHAKNIPHSLRKEIDELIQN